MTVIPHQRQLDPILGADGGHPVGAGAGGTVTVYPLAEGIGCGSGLTGLLLVPAGIDKAVIRAEELLVREDEQPAAALLQQGFAQGILPKQRVQHGGVQVGVQVAFGIAADAAVGLLLDHGGVGFKDHLADIHHIFGKQQSLAVLDLQDAPQHRRGGAVSLVGIGAQGHILIALALHIAAQRGVGQGRTGRKKQQRCQESKQLFHVHPP